MEQVNLVLMPLGSGEDTIITMNAQIDSCVAAECVGALLRLLADCSGQPVCVALPVDSPPNDWFELWGDAIEQATPGTVEIRFAMLRDLVPNDVPQ